jgi:hypothetical protein
MSILLGTKNDLGVFKPAITLGQQWPTERVIKVGGVDKTYPITYLDKDLIEDGQYVHPQTGRVVHATRNQIKDWVSKFNQMSSTGVLEPNVPVDHSIASRDNLGFVKAARAVEFTNPAGEKKLRLRLTHALIGEDAAQIALRNRASLGIDPNYVDGKGKNWGSVIVHSAITSTPVVAGMGEFAPASVTLSRGQQTEIYLQSAKESSNMLTPELRTKLAKIVEVNPSDASVTDEVLLSRVVTEFETIETDMVTVNREIEKLQTTANEATTQLQTLSREIPDAPDDNVLSLLSNSFATDREAAVLSGGVDSATANDLHNLLCPGGKPGTVALSRNGADITPLYTRFFKRLRDNKPVMPNGRDQTGIQMSRQTPGAASTSESAEATRKRMIEVANRGKVNRR